MYEIKNKNKGPIQLVVRSKLSPKQFTVLNIPGVGKGNNVRYIEDEVVTDYIKRIEKLGLISTRYVPNNEIIQRGD